MSVIVSNITSIKSQATQPFVQQHNFPSSLSTCSLWGNTPVAVGFPAQRASCAGSVSMSWHPNVLAPYVRIWIWIWRCPRTHCEWKHKMDQPINWTSGLFRRLFDPLTSGHNIRVNVTIRMSAPMCRHVERCRHLYRHLDVPTRADIWMLFGSWDVLTCASTSKVPTPEKVPTRADTSRCRHVPTPLGADTCRHLWYQSYELYLDTGRCRHLERCRHVLACVNTSRCRHRCRHIYVPTRADIWMLFGSWHMLTCVSTSKVPTPEKVPTHADTSRCRHVPTPVISVIWTLLGYWEVLANASTWKGADT